MRYADLICEAAFHWTPPRPADEWEEVSENPSLEMRQYWLSLFPTERDLASAVIAGRAKSIRPQAEWFDNREFGLDDLDPGKLARVAGLFATGSAEMPIVVQDKANRRATLLSGNTRLNYAEAHHIPVTVWVIAPQLNK